MLATSNFISSADHCRITEYTLEFRLCGKQGCIVCAKIGFGVRMPEISIKGKNILGELLRWFDLPVIKPIYKSCLLSTRHGPTLTQRAHLYRNIWVISLLWRRIRFWRKFLQMEIKRTRYENLIGPSSEYSSSVMVLMITDVYTPIKWLELRVAWQNLTWGSFSDGRS